MTEALPDWNVDQTVFALGAGYVLERAEAIVNGSPNRQIGRGVFGLDMGGLAVDWQSCHST